MEIRKKFETEIEKVLNMAESNKDFINNANNGELFRQLDHETYFQFHIEGEILKDKRKNLHIYPNIQNQEKLILVFLCLMVLIISIIMTVIF
jgi:hypothetical protein